MTALIAVAALALTGCHSHACQERVEAKRFEATDRVLRHRCHRKVTACIDRAAHLHRVSRSWMRSIAWCESRLRPWASNGTHFGLFQFDRATWSASPYARRGSPWSAKWASLATAWFLRRGQASRWVCA